MTRNLTLAIGGVVAAASAVAVFWSQGPAVPATAASRVATTPVSAVTGVDESAGVNRNAGVNKNGVSAFPLAPSQADKQRVAAYWSPERLKQASSYVPSTKPSPSTRSTTSAVEMGPGDAKTHTRTPRGAAPPPVASPPMVGKVFFKVGDKEFWCSASAVHSAHRNLVATAGHCAYALSQDKPVQNWVFIPGYHDGVAPSGIFVGHTLYMQEDFAGQGDFDRDYAFVTVHRGFSWQPYVEGGRLKYRSVDVGRLEDKVGAFRFASGKPLGRQTYVFGYPAGANPDGTRPYTGQTVKSCDGITEKKFVSAPTWQLEHGVRLAGCPFTAGASGGPWVIGYNATTRTGYLAGITSLTWNLNGGGRLDAVSTPYFNQLTQRVYTQASKQGTG
ncbi:trypsin-like serine protease [Microbispora sp. SCL1-1]|uniref:trypsin-like serine peptidase n=1 Tax=Microbispora TaxID=2005 RepID=UPI001158B792|nr:trypsin-like serine protease [Microbispora sp. SCL1-1]NJP28920.1 trypsin-like serine protease [Microbispora sp. CL1-1]TQS06995.1 trypsin-like serine protease [Microbispora sp. SCL1-1]